MMRKTYGFELKGEKDFLSLIDANPDDYHSRLRLSDIYVRRKKIALAIEQYKFAMESLSKEGKQRAVNAIKGIIKMISPDSISFDDSFRKKEPIKEKTKKHSNFTKEDVFFALRNFEVFKDVETDDIEKILKTVQLRRFQPEEIIIKQGEEGDSIFLILEGSVKIIYETEIGKIVELAFLSKGEFFGEMAFYGKKIRQATVVSVDYTTLIEFNREKIEDLIKKSESIKLALEKYYKERILDVIIATSPLFSGVSYEVRQDLISRFKLRTFQPGDIIIKQNDPSDAMYIIKSGKVRVIVEKDGELNEIALLNSGEFFGEIGLVTGQKRTASVVALTRVEAMELTKDDLDAIIAKHPDILNILKNYIKQRTTDTFRKLVELKRLNLKKGLV